MKDETLRVRSMRRQKALLWTVVVLFFTVLFEWGALRLLDDTRSYLETQRSPVLIPGGGAKF